MSILRRSLLKRLAASAAGALSAPLTFPLLAGADEAGKGPGGPKRVVFFLQAHGFFPVHAQPSGMGVIAKAHDRVEIAPLAAMDLPHAIGPLMPYRDRLTIIQGLNGKHVSPYHGGPFGALGGFKKQASRPLGETIDCALAGVLPGVVPLLAMGWESLKTMQSSPVHYASSAWGDSKAVPMYCDPVLAYRNLFGVAKPGQDRQSFEADTALYDFVKGDAAAMDRRLTGAEQAKFHPYLAGYEEAGVRRRRLVGMADTLARHAPAFDGKFTKPQFESDWWDASLRVAIGALTAGVTNVLTISSGLCASSGTWFGLGCTTVGHSLGHTGPENPDWTTIRRWDMEALVRIMKALQAIPEGTGTMMDNTLIVYTSDSGESQHSTGNRWPFLLLGNLGGTLRSGRYIRYPVEPSPQSRTINALYNTLLHAVGAPRDRFNLAGGLKDLDRPGPLPELLA